VISTYWHHTRTSARQDMPCIKVSHRQRLIGGDSGEPHVLIEDIVLESLEKLQVQDDGTEHDYSQLRRRK
jgi:hypothetical protein